MKKKKRVKKAQSAVLAYDLGGTKVAVGIVNARGKILEEVRCPVSFEKGKAAVFRQLGELGRNLLRKHRGIRTCGVGSAGPLHPEKGWLLNPTNMSSPGEAWEKVALTSLLKKELKIPVFLENDAAAAVLAECWVGSGKKSKNVIVLTLGTGLGMGVVCNGSLVRSGRGLHTEGGHVILRAEDSTAPCGCGNFGCSEAFLSGTGFAHRFNSKNGTQLSAREIAEKARRGDSSALEAFQEYSSLMATAIHNYVVLFSPELVVFTGSFASAHDLFIENTRSHLEKLLLRRRVGFDLMPALGLSALGNEAGLIGGAFVGLNKGKVGIA